MDTWRFAPLARFFNLFETKSSTGIFFQSPKKKMRFKLFLVLTFEMILK